MGLEDENVTKNCVAAAQVSNKCNKTRFVVLVCNCVCLHGDIEQGTKTNAWESLSHVGSHKANFFFSDSWFNQGGCQKTDTAAHKVPEGDSKSIDFRHFADNDWLHSKGNSTDNSHGYTKDIITIRDSFTIFKNFVRCGLLGCGNDDHTRESNYHCDNLVPCDHLTEEEVGKNGGPERTREEQNHADRDWQVFDGKEVSVGSCDTDDDTANQVDTVLFGHKQVNASN